MVVSITSAPSPFLLACALRAVTVPSSGAQTYRSTMGFRDSLISGSCAIGWMLDLHTHHRDTRCAPGLCQSLVGLVEILDRRPRCSLFVSISLTFAGGDCAE